MLGAGMWDHPEGMPVCLATAAGGDNGLSQSVHPPAKYSIGVDSIFGMHFKCAFQQEPCRISATDPAAGLPGVSCPFPVRKDVPGTESSRGACRQPHTPRARPAGLGKAGSVAADCCLLLIRSFFLCLAAEEVLSLPSESRYEHGHLESSPRCSGVATVGQCAPELRGTKP